MDKRRVKTDEDQTWVGTLRHIGWNAVDVLRSACQVLVRWNQWRWSQRGKCGPAGAPLDTMSTVL